MFTGSHGEETCYVCRHERDFTSCALNKTVCPHGEVKNSDQLSLPVKNAMQRYWSLISFLIHFTKPKRFICPAQCLIHLFKVVRYYNQVLALKRDTLHTEIHCLIQYRISQHTNGKVFLKIKKKPTTKHILYEHDCIKQYLCDNEVVCKLLSFIVTFYRY